MLHRKHSNMVSLEAFKVIAMVSIFAIGMFGSFTPFVIARCGGGLDSTSGWGQVLPVLNAASAGVFIGAGLMHMLADALSNEDLSERSAEFWGDEERGSLFAISLCAAGFFLLLIAEQTVAGCAQGSCMGKKQRRSAKKYNKEPLQSGDNEPVRASDNDVEDNAIPIIASDAEHPAMNALIQSEEPHVHMVPNSTIVAVAIGLGLSLHGVMEGIALGAQVDTSIIGIFVAIMAHKGIAAFALGVKTWQIAQQRSTSERSAAAWFSACMLLFSMTTPIGIGVGWGVTEAADAEDGLWSAVFSALGAGTFLYVATVEVIPAELSHSSDNRGPKTTALIAGAVLMGSLARWV